MATEITTDDKVEALSRELKMRIRVYARLVMDGRMTQAKSDHEIAVIKVMLADYQALQQKELLL